MNGGRVESFRRIKDGNGRLTLKEDKARKIWKDYFEDVYNIDTQGQVAVYMCGFDGIQRGNYFGREPIRRTEVEVRIGKLQVRMRSLERW